MFSDARRLKGLSRIPPENIRRWGLARHTKFDLSISLSGQRRLDWHPMPHLWEKIRSMKGKMKAQKPQENQMLRHNKPLSSVL
jgi:hypothetical protein